MPGAGAAVQRREDVLTLVLSTAAVAARSGTLPAAGRMGVCDVKPKVKIQFDKGCTESAAELAVAVEGVYPVLLDGEPDSWSVVHLHVDDAYGTDLWLAYHDGMLCAIGCDADDVSNRIRDNFLPDEEESIALPPRRSRPGETQ